MKVVGLISGGKDSLFNLLECRKYGHEIIALANLYPSEEEIDELDSFTFQTVGHQMIQAIANAMKLPLIRYPIKGGSVNQTLQYAQTDNDEVEDLFELLKKVKELFPEVQAVSSGAILSNYQRTRIENVCSRLELTSLTYLWRENQAELLQKMIQEDMKMILVKTASSGLIPRIHLGKYLHDLYDTFISLSNTDGLNVCGEGGEYESLVVDCPLYFEKLVIDSYEMHGPLDNQYAPSEPKDISPTVVHDTKSGGSWMSQSYPKQNEEIVTSNTVYQPSFNHSDNMVCITSQGHNFSGSVSEKMHQCLQYVGYQLMLAGCSFSDVFFVHLFLDDMNDYAVVNPIYSLYFKKPPSRASVATTFSIEVLACSTLKHSLPPGFDERCIVKNNVGSVFFERMHVQSISNWAPANIGPYAQAIVMQGFLFLAGQIGLNPSTMLLREPSVQLMQCLSNCKNVLSALKSDINNLLEVVIYTTTGTDVLQENAEIYKPVQLCSSAIILGVNGLPRGAAFELQLTAWQPRIKPSFHLQELNFSENETLFGVGKFVSKSFCSYWVSGALTNCISSIVKAADISSIKWSNLLWFRVYYTSAIEASKFQKELVELFGTFNLIAPVTSYFCVNSIAFLQDKLQRSFAVHVCFYDMTKHQTELWLHNVSDAEQVC